MDQQAQLKSTSNLLPKGEDRADGYTRSFKGYLQDCRQRHNRVLRRRVIWHRSYECYRGSFSFPGSYQGHLTSSDSNQRDNKCTLERPYHLMNATFSSLWVTRGGDDNLCQNIGQDNPLLQFIVFYCFIDIDITSFRSLFFLGILIEYNMLCMICTRDDTLPSQGYCLIMRRLRDLHSNLYMFRYIKKGNSYNYLLFLGDI